MFQDRGPPRNVALTGRPQDGDLGVAESAFGDGHGGLRILLGERRERQADHHVADRPGPDPGADLGPAGRDWNDLGGPRRTDMSDRRQNDQIVLHRHSSERRLTRDLDARPTSAEPARRYGRRRRPRGPKEPV